MEGGLWGGAGWEWERLGGPVTAGRAKNWENSASDVRIILHHTLGPYPEGHKSTGAQYINSTLHQGA